MSGYTDEEWEEIGRKWREAAGIGHTSRLDAPAFIRWLKHSGYINDYVCVPASELPNGEGKFDPDQGKIFYPENVWADAERGIPRAIWTLIHEGCHAILKHKELRHRAAGANRLSLATNRDEHQAHRLTASIVAPFDEAGFKPGMTADDLCHKFGLSLSAAARRLEEFARIYRRKHGVRRALPPGVADFLVEQKRKGYRVTSLDDSAPVPRPPVLYEGESCPCCQAFKLVRNGLGMKCEICGTRTGDD